MSQDKPQVHMLTLLRRLRDAHISCRLGSARPEAVMVEVAVPGERWEIEILDDGSIEIERFKSDGTISDERELGELFSNFSNLTNVTGSGEN